MAQHFAYFFNYFFLAFLLCTRVFQNNSKPHKNKITPYFNKTLNLVATFNQAQLNWFLGLTCFMQRALLMCFWCLVAAPENYMVAEGMAQPGGRLYTDDTEKRESHKQRSGIQSVKKRKFC